MNLNKQEKEVLIFHIIFGFLSVIILIIPLIEIGWKLFILVIIYNLGSLLFSSIRDYKDWRDIWFFSFLISIFQVFPDWVLSAELNILIFPEDGLFKIGTVSGYMIGLWTIPLFVIIYSGIQMKERTTYIKSSLFVALISFLIFTISEASIWMIGSWYPQNVFALFNHLAVYVIFPEIILGLSSYLGFIYIVDKNQLYKLPIAFIIMLIYLGGCVFFYFLVEKIILS
ncbi:MAG: hypothetical protein EU518_02085 [Promethearchaeota archaeon]|nr:MAG: hypothetical protein EU518_02085 [Candidatus Lokiarchaeota archaeon]